MRARTGGGSYGVPARLAYWELSSWPRAFSRPCLRSSRSSCLACSRSSRSSCLICLRSWRSSVSRSRSSSRSFAARSLCSFWKAASRSALLDPLSKLSSFLLPVRFGPGCVLSSQLYPAGVQFKTSLTGSSSRLVVLGLRDVPWADYDLQGLRYHREDGGLIPYDLSVDGELQAPRARLDPDLLRPGKEDPFFVEVVRSSKNRGGELEHLLHPDVFYDHEVQEPVLGVGPRRREPTATGVAAVADR